MLLLWVDVQKYQIAVGGLIVNSLAGRLLETGGSEIRNLLGGVPLFLAQREKRFPRQRESWANVQDLDHISEACCCACVDWDGTSDGGSLEVAWGGHLFCETR